MPPVFISIEENPNCTPMAGQVFQPRKPPRPITHVRREQNGVEQWCAVTGLDEDFHFTPAMACLIEDSGEGACYLIFGGTWGLRLKSDDSSRDWDLADPGQSGEPFLLLAADDSELRFQ